MVRGLLRKLWRLIGGNLTWDAIGKVWGLLVPGGASAMVTTIVQWASFWELPIWGVVLFFLVGYLVFLKIILMLLQSFRDEKQLSTKETPTPEKSRLQIAAEVLVEDYNRVANMPKEERAQRDEEWRRAMPPPDLTGETVTVTISSLQRFPTKALIKIVSTPEYTEWAKELATIFRLSGFVVMVTPKATEGIFSAKVKHDRLVLRFPAEDEPKTYDGKQRHLKYHTLSLMPVFVGFEVAHFDSSSGNDYFQVEIKGAP